MTCTTVHAQALVSSFRLESCLSVGQSCPLWRCAFHLAQCAFSDVCASLFGCRRQHDNIFLEGRLLPGDAGVGAYRAPRGRHGTRSRPARGSGGLRGGRPCIGIGHWYWDSGWVRVFPLPLLPISILSFLCLSHFLLFAPAPSSLSALRSRVVVVCRCSC